MTKPLVLIWLALSSCASTPDLPDTLLASACDTAKRVDRCPTCTCKVSSVTTPLRDADQRSHGVVLDVVNPGEADRASQHIAIGDATQLSYVTLAGTSEVIDHVSTEHTMSARAQVVVADLGVVHPFDATHTTHVRDASGVARAESYSFALLCWRAPDPVCWNMQVGHETRVETGPKKAPTVTERTTWIRTWSLSAAGEIVLDEPTGNDMDNAFPTGTLREALASFASSRHARRIWVKIP